MTTPLAGSGRCQWNALTWFGILLGSTFWILPLGIMYCFKDTLVAAIVLTAFGIAIAVGLGLWLARGRVRPFPAIIILIGVCAAATAATFLTLDLTGYLNDFEPQVGRSRNIYTVLLVYLVLFFRFYLLEAHAKRHLDDDDS